MDLNATRVDRFSVASLMERRRDLGETFQRILERAWRGLLDVEGS